MADKKWQMETNPPVVGTISNPVFGEYFADPFAWRHEGVYYAVGTGRSEAEGHPAGRVFPLLQSRDFFSWEPVGRALERPEHSLGNNFWAPEIAFHNGRFYLYYSVGFEDKNHRLRVATSDTPCGPYRDVGQDLLSLQECPFAIDPHPFRDEDGQWYLFYARDFLDHTAPFRPGTGLMVAKMKSMTELENPGMMVARAQFDWQRFEANRLMYGRRWDWHTLEGPCVVARGSSYYCLFSGGRWETTNYGVDYAVAGNVMGPYSCAGNSSGPRVLKSIPGKVLGPGHNSVVTGPDGTTPFIVYHAWDAQMTARRMFIDRLVWGEDGPRCSGPTVGGVPLSGEIRPPKAAQGCR